MRLRESGTPCYCEDVPIEAVYPVCPDCGHPIAASKDDPTHGFCSFRYEGGRCFYDRNVIPPDEFVWVRVDVFNQSDLPPWNGWKPVNVKDAERWLEARREQ